MPTLIRLFIVLVVLAGIGLAGMIALTVMVDPGQKEITVKIPARDLTPSGGGGGGPLDLDNLPAPVNVISASSELPSEESTPSAPPESGDVQTIEAPGTE